MARPGAAVTTSSSGRCRTSAPLAPPSSASARGSGCASASSSGARVGGRSRSPGSPRCPTLPRANRRAGPAPVPRRGQRRSRGRRVDAAETVEGDVVGAGRVGQRSKGSTNPTSVTVVARFDARFAVGAMTRPASSCRQSRRRRCGGSRTVRSCSTARPARSLPAVVARPDADVQPGRLLAEHRGAVVEAVGDRPARAAREDPHLAASRHGRGSRPHAPR